MQHFRPSLWLKAGTSPHLPPFLPFVMRDPLIPDWEVVELGSPDRVEVEGDGGDEEGRGGSGAQGGVFGEATFGLASVNIVPTSSPRISAKGRKSILDDMGWRNSTRQLGWLSPICTIEVEAQNHQTSYSCSGIAEAVSTWFLEQRSLSRFCFISN